MVMRIYHGNEVVVYGPATRTSKASEPLGVLPTQTYITLPEQLLIPSMIPLIFSSFLFSAF